jgi:16S rRNA (cytidine1402-2'-O)-methyltransferase
MNATAGDGAGRVILAATPLGSPGDASERLRAALAGTPVLAAEDTRRVRRLCSDLGVQPGGRVVSFFDANEQGRVPQLLEMLRAGEDVLVVTDAGMPALSDPGYRLVSAAAREGILVTCLPGPSAVTTALAVSGLPVDRFCFEGFPPRRAGERGRRLAELAAEARTMVFFESPRRIAVTLAELADAFGEGRRAALCRELTKTHEEISRGTLAELAQATAAREQAGGVKGEITLVVAGAPAPGPQGTAQDAVAEVARRVRAGARRGDAITAVAGERGLRRRELYNTVVNQAP